MALFEVTANDRKIYEEELRDFLPDRLFDVHCHVSLECHKPAVQLKPGEVKRTVSWPSLVAKQNSIEELQETYRLFFPGKECRALIFSGESHGEAVNQYISASSKQSGFPALYFSHPNQTADEIETEIRRGGFLGLKSYLDLSPKYLPEAEIRIFDFFPKHQLARLNEMGGICMLHIPRHGRLKDPVNIQQILEIKREFPNVLLVVAHIGRAYTRGDIGDAFDRLTQASDLLYDFCANCCEYAITELIRRVGPKQVMFGLDLPILRMRTHRIEENGTYVNLVPPGLYGDLSGDSHMREVSGEEAEKITFFAYEELLAFKRAAQTLQLTKEDIEDILCRNAENMVEQARRNIYGE